MHLRVRGFRMERRPGGGNSGNFSGQEKGRPQTDRASGVPGRVVSKRKDAPLAPPLTFLRSQRLPVRTNHLLTQETQNPLGADCPSAAPGAEGAWEVAALHRPAQNT